MSKGILILNEIQKNCYRCKITGSCRNLTKKNPDFNLVDDRPYWCPLKETPNGIDNYVPEDADYWFYYRGWYDCKEKFISRY